MHRIVSNLLPLAGARRRLCAEASPLLRVSRRAAINELVEWLTTLLTDFSCANYGPKVRGTNSRQRKESLMSDSTLSVHNPHEPVPFISLVTQHQTIAHEVTAAVGRVLA